MPTRKVVLTTQQQEFVEELVRSGRYQNASEVLREGLRLVEQHEPEEAAKLKALQTGAEQGWADVAADRFIDLTGDGLDDFIDRLGARAAASGSSTAE
jgi:antitoxin ParD1/3/4